MRDTQRERGKDIGRGRSRLFTGAWCGTRSRSQDFDLSWRQPPNCWATLLSLISVLICFFLMTFVNLYTYWFATSFFGLHSVSMNCLFKVLWLFLFSLGFCFFFFKYWVFFDFHILRIKVLHVINRSSFYIMKKLKLFSQSRVVSSPTYVFRWGNNLMFDKVKYIIFKRLCFWCHG